MVADIYTKRIRTYYCYPDYIREDNCSALSRTMSLGIANCFDSRSIVCNAICKIHSTGWSLKNRKSIFSWDTIWKRRKQRVLVEFNGAHAVFKKSPNLLYDKRPLCIHTICCLIIIHCYRVSF